MFDEFLQKSKKLLVDDIQNFKATMDASHEMMCLSLDAKATYLNPSWITFTGRTLEEELGNGRFDGIHPDEYTDTVQAIHTAFFENIPYRVKYRLKNSSDQYYWFVENGMPIFSSQNIVLGYVSGCINIDTETKLEMKLQAAEIKYRRLFEAAHDGILILDSTTGEITDVNPFLKELLGYSKEEFLGKKLWEVGAFKNIKASKDTFKMLQETGYARYDDLPLETKDGKLIPVEFVSNVYKAGELNVIQCNIRDISERKKMEEVEKTMTAIKQEQQKSMFIADVTHELRTPLAIIKGNVDLALRDKVTIQREVFEAINLEVNHLSLMLLDLAILTTDNKIFQKKIASHKISLVKIIKQVVERLKTLSNRQHIRITLRDIPPIFIQGDAMYLEKLFSNIISNAIYYGKTDGYVNISGRIVDKQIEISIEDNGIGIPEVDIPNIFERFFRSEKAREVNHEGTGLGLAISKWIVDAHRGYISVTSTIDTGTTFVISLPIIE